MTAAAATTERAPRLTLVETKTVNPLARVRSWFGRALAFLNDKRRSAWNWVKRTLHLESVADAAGSSLAWVKAKFWWALEWVGSGGIAGLGLMGVATDTGRKAISYAFRPVRWVGGRIADAWFWAEDALTNDKDGGARNWTADRMVDVREFFFGSTNKGNRSHGNVGVFGKAHAWYSDHVAPWVSVEGLIMAGVRLVAGALLVSRLAALSLLMPYRLPWVANDKVVFFIGEAAQQGAIRSFVNRIISLFKAIFTGRDDEGRFASVTSVATADPADGSGDEAAAAVTKAVPITAPVNRAQARGRQPQKATTRRGR